jgi:hypothetical protein
VVVSRAPNSTAGVLGVGISLVFTVWRAEPDYVVAGCFPEAGAVKARILSLSKSTRDSGGDEDSGDEHLCTVSKGTSSGSGTMVHVRHSRRWWTGRVGLDGGCFVQF